MPVRWQTFISAALAVSVSAVLMLAQEPLIQRGAPQLVGDNWVEQIQCRIPVKPGGRLVIHADPGIVQVSPGSDGEVKCLIDLASYNRDPQKAKTCLDHYGIKAVRVGDGALIETQPVCSRGSGLISAKLEVSVPLKFNLDVKTQGGNVRVEKLDGQLRADTAGGDIRAGDVRGPVWVSTAGGMIDLGNIGQTVFARSKGGNIRVGNVNGNATLETSGGVIMAGVVNGSMTAETAGGDIVMQAASGPVVVETAGGQIHLGECGNSVQAQTAGGNIQVAGARGGVKAETSGGNITLLKIMGPVTAQTPAGRILAQIAASGRTFGPSRLETQVGDVDVFIPPALPVTINAMINHTMGHRIMSDFPLTDLTTDKNFAFGPESAKVLLHGGGNTLDIRTAMGNIQIRKLDPASAAALDAYQQSFWKNWNWNWNDV
ncbi:MAG: DUF4097 family beta strand repeat-containing protein, partial [Terriglobia bacterium]